MYFWFLFMAFCILSFSHCFLWYVRNFLHIELLCLIRVYLLLFLFTWPPFYVILTLLSFHSFHFILLYSILLMVMFNTVLPACGQFLFISIRQNLTGLLQRFVNTQTLKKLGFGCDNIKIKHLCEIKNYSSWLLELTKHVNQLVKTHMSLLANRLNSCTVRGFFWMLYWMKSPDWPATICWIGASMTKSSMSS